MTGPSERVIAFAVAGIFGAGRLANRLKELESDRSDRAMARWSLDRLHAQGNPNTVQQPRRCENGSK